MNQCIKILENAKEGSIFSLRYLKLNPSLGIEPKFVGAMCVSAPGLMSKPVIGGAAVYVFNVNSKEGRTLSEADEKVRLEAQATSYITERLSQALNDETEIVDNRIKFF